MPDAPVHLTRPQAARIALAAQGFTRPRPALGTVGVRDLQRVVDTVKVVQIDSVNVVTRSQYLPFFSRLGPYDPALLDRFRDVGPRRLVEYWVHEASLISPATWPLLDFRMQAAGGIWGGIARVAVEHPDLPPAVLSVIATQGPLTAREVEAQLAHDAPRRDSGWGWRWSAVKTALEFLFWTGQVTSAGRTAQFERRYAVPTRVLPRAQGALAADPELRPRETEAVRELVAQAAMAMGVASEQCLRDYHRLTPDQVRPALAALLDDGTLLPARVEGWHRPTYLHRAAARPRRVQARALLSPFDSLIWQRDRTRAIFDFDFKLEIYTPAPQRRYGYYVLPFLLGEALVARVDLKADRAAGVLRAHRVTWEQGRGSEEERRELDAELALLAQWLGLTGVS